MCGILFAIRSSASYHATGGSPAESSSPLESHASPAGSDFGIPLPDGSHAAHLDANEVWDTMVDAVSSRGPDAHRSLIRRALVEKTFHFELRFHASVLHMRGPQVTEQPFESPEGDVLLWNGEIFDGLTVGPGENDGQVLFDTIRREGPTNFFAAIRNVEGPYAFIYYQKVHNRIYFARDPLGRRSLLMHAPTPSCPFLVLSSNGPSADFPLKEWEEVGCDALHCYHLNDLKGKSWLVDGKRGLSSYPRYPRSMGLSQDILIYPFDQILPTLPSPSSLLPISPTGGPTTTSALHLTMQNLLRELESSVRKRVSPLPSLPALPHARVAVLFSGGIDCTTIALLVDRVLGKGEAVDLINVAFENPRKVQSEEREREARARSRAKAKGKGPATDVMEVDGREDEEPPAVSVYDVPDRLTGRDSWRELQRLRPARTWNLVEVDVPYAEMLQHRQKVIDLMRPNRTVMDLSISLAFYFAARGEGHLSSSLTPYHSYCRILLSGLGADELFGGYARHRKSFERGGWAALIAELQLDVDRLPSRNLGRDDRIISYWGKEARYPFLAGHVVDFCSRTEIQLKCDLRFTEGVGDKLLLRLLAKSLGLDDASQLKKRAIHFGARTAKMELDSGGLKGEMLLE